MKMKKLRTITASGDACEINIDTFNADIEIISTADPVLSIKFSGSLRPHFTEKDGRISVSQKKTLLSRIVRPCLKIFVPECTVPDVNVNMQTGNIAINGGIYNDTVIRGGEIKAQLSGATFENLQVKADALDVSAENMTVKNIANTLAGDGRVEIDKTFCKKAECRVKKGNIGICNSSCDYAILNSEEGNIAASMLGCESDYTVALNGNICGKKGGNPAKCIKARAAKGSVVLDFENGPRFIEADEMDYEELGA